MYVNSYDVVPSNDGQQIIPVANDRLVFLAIPSANMTIWNQVPAVLPFPTYGIQLGTFVSVFNWPFYGALVNGPWFQVTGGAIAGVCITEVRGKLSELTQIQIDQLIPQAAKNASVRQWNSKAVEEAVNRMRLANVPLRYPNVNPVSQGIGHYGVNANTWTKPAQSRFNNWQSRNKRS